MASDKNAMPTLDTLFGGAEISENEITLIDDALIDEFPGHPYRLYTGKRHTDLLDSIREFGVLSPVILRAEPTGRYTLLAGYNRRHCNRIAGNKQLPSVVMYNVSDGDAKLIITHSNRQRGLDELLPSEKAFAFKMKLDAIKHQGKTSVQVAEKLLSVEKVAGDAGESKDQVRRYIRLTYLIPELLSMVDDGKIAFNPAVELSYLDSYQQRAVLDAMSLNDCTPSHAQSIRLKKLAQEGVLDDQMIYTVLAETKPNQQEQLKFKREELRKYFPSGYTEEQMRRDIIKGLELLRRQRERNRDAR